MAISRLRSWLPSARFVELVWAGYVYLDRDESSITNNYQGILRAVGVGGGVAAAGVVETGDVIDLWRRLAEGIGFG